MSENIAIKDIIDANSHNSAMALTASWANVFKKYALEEYEDLTDDPASGFNIFTHLTAQGAAKMMYEQEARIAEVNESTAILPKSLLNKLTTEELLGIFGTPASTTIAFCIKKKEIIDYSILVDEPTGLRRLVLNKDMKVVFESHPEFTLPYNVEINVKPITSRTFDDATGEEVITTDYNIYAYYDMPSKTNDGMRSIFQIYDQFISSREMRFEGETYVAFFLKVFHLNRTETTVYISDPNTADMKISFDDSLIGVEVFRKKANTNQEVLMTGFTEGSNLTTDSYNYSYDYKRNKQNYNIIFSKMNDNTSLSVGDTIRVVTYTTKGSEGNVEFPYMIYNINKLSASYNQNLTDATQNALLNIITLIFARDKAATGGKDQLTLEEIREKIINKKYSRNILITNNEIINKGKEKGLAIERIRHDLMTMSYRATDKIRYKNMILSTGMNNFYFNVKDKDRIVRGYNYYMIEPTDVFAFNSENNRLEFKPLVNQNNPENNLEPYFDYVEKYNTSANIDKIKQVVFPFYIRYENTANPKVQIYDMCLNETDYLKFTGYNEDISLDKLDISFIRITRNPYRGSKTGTFDRDLSNTYFINFIVYTGQNTLNKMYAMSHNVDNTKNYVNAETLTDYMKQYVTFELSLEGINDGIRYIVNPTNVKVVNPNSMLEDGYIAYQASITTNNFISNDKQIQLKGIRNSNYISYDYGVFVPVDTTVKFRITGTFRNDSINPDNKHCIEYESDNVKLVDYMTDYFDCEFDIQTVIPGYKTFEEDIPYKYEETEFYENPNYEPSIEDTSNVNHYPYLIEKDDDGNPIFNIIDNVSCPVYKIAHNVGDIIYEHIRTEDEEPYPGKEYFIYDETLRDFVKVENLIEFEPDVIYFSRKAKIKHYKGEYIYYKVNENGIATGEYVDEPDEIAKTNPNNKLEPLPVEYIGVIKNVAWINRLYFAGEEMYEKIRSFYLEMIDRMITIKNTLFDGGTIVLGLQTTSGASKKYRAYNLETNNGEYLNNIALKFTFRVKYKDNSSLDYKRDQIINATVNYVNNLGDNNLSTDQLFDAIKAEVPDIEYINILNINNYTNGSVQTIINDTSVSSEMLTLSQKVIVDDNGDVDFEPDVTINVV